jgi:hypothetical protein
MPNSDLLSCAVTELITTSYKRYDTVVTEIRTKEGQYVADTNGWDEKDVLDLLRTFYSLAYSEEYHIAFKILLSQRIAPTLEHAEVLKKDVAYYLSKVPVQFSKILLNEITNKSLEDVKNIIQSFHYDEARVKAKKALAQAQGVIKKEGAVLTPSNVKIHQALENQALKAQSNKDSADSDLLVDSSCSSTSAFPGSDSIDSVDSGDKLISV